MNEPDPDLPPGVVRLHPRPDRPGGPIHRRRRFVYDVDFREGRYVVVFQGQVITTHADQVSALENARLIAGNFWSEGIPTSVRVIERDGSISPVVSFG